MRLLVVVFAGWGRSALGGTRHLGFAEVLEFSVKRFWVHHSERCEQLAQRQMRVLLLRSYGGDLARRIQDPKFDGGLAKMHRLLAMQLEDFHDLAFTEEPGPRLHAASISVKNPRRREAVFPLSPRLFCRKRIRGCARDSLRQAPRECVLMSSANEISGRTVSGSASDRNGPASKAVYAPMPLPDAQRKGVFVVIPAYNEAVSIGDVVASVREVYPNVIVVDDGSADETGRLALEAGAIRLRHVVNRGQGAALQSGIEYAVAQQAEVVVTFDADGQHAVSDIAKIIAPILEGQVDVTLGSRFLGQRPEMPRARRLLLKGGLLFTQWTSGARLTDTHNGLRAFSRSAASQIRIRLDGMAHASELIEYIHLSGLAYREVPVRIQYTAYSLAKGQRSSGAIRIVFDYFMDKFFL